MCNCLYFLVNNPSIMGLKTALHVREVMSPIPFRYLEWEIFCMLLGKAAVRKWKSCAVCFRL